MPLREREKVQKVSRLSKLRVKRALNGQIIGYRIRIAYETHKALEFLQYARAHTPRRRSGPKIGRNDPCFCGSGKKLKQCHGESHGKRY